MIAWTPGTLFGERQPSSGPPVLAYHAPRKRVRASDMERAIAACLKDHGIIGREKRVQAVVLCAMLEAYVGYAPSARVLCDAVSRMRMRGEWVLSSFVDGGGYWIAASGDEVEAFLKPYHNYALSMLMVCARMRRLALPELRGQIWADLLEAYRETPDTEIQKEAVETARGAQT